MKGILPNTVVLATLTNRKNQIRIFSLPAVLGRNNNVVDIYFFHESISREHCRFGCSGGRLTIRDLGSTAGTWVNGTKLDAGATYFLNDGDKVTIGQVKFDLNVDSVAMSRFRSDKPDQAAAPAQAPVQAPYQTLQMGAPAQAPYQTLQMGAPTPAAAPATAVPIPVTAVPAQTVAPQQPQPAAAPQDAAHKKAVPRTVEIFARELNELEYDENEVVYIDCGLRAPDKPLSYTQELSRDAVEAALAAGPADTPAEDIFTEVSVEAAPAEEPLAAEPVEVSAEEFFADEPAEETAEEPPVAETEEAVEDAPTEEPEPAEPGTVVMSWTDPETGEAKEIFIDHFPFSIGRKYGENDYVIRKDGVSRKHMRIDFADGVYYLYDDDSTNGVKLNGERIPVEENVVLSDGDTVRAAGIDFSTVIR